MPVLPVAWGWAPVLLCIWYYVPLLLCICGSAHKMQQSLARMWSDSVLPVQNVPDTVYVVHAVP